MDFNGFEESPFTLFALLAIALYLLLINYLINGLLNILPHFQLNHDAEMFDLSEFNHFVLIEVLRKFFHSVAFRLLDYHLKGRQLINSIFSVDSFQNGDELGSLLTVVISDNLSMTELDS